MKTIKNRKWQKKCLSCVCCGVLLSGVSGVYAAESDTADYTLDQVVVTATKTKKPVKEVTASVTVITSAMIQNSTATTVTELLSTVPGVATNGRGSLGIPGSISMRGLNGGGGSAKVQVLMDGRPLNMGFGTAIDWNTIPLENIERIEVVRGPSSALYGGNGLSGTINIITKKSAGQDHTYFDTSVGSFGTQQSSFVQEGKSGNTNYIITGDYGKSDGYVPHSDYEGHNFTARFDTDSDWIFRSGYNTYNQTNFNLNTKTYPLGYDFTNSEAYYFDVEKKFTNDNVDTSVRAYYNHANPITTLTSGKTYSNWDNTLQGIALQQDLKLAKQHTLTWGTEYQSAAANDTEDITAKNVKNYGYNTYALFLQDDRHLTARLLLNMGGRYDHNSTYGGQFSPKFGLAYDVAADTTLKLNIAKAFKAPSLSDLNTNPNLKPTTEWSYEIGVDKQFNPLTKGSIVFYKMDTENNIIKGNNVTATNVNMHPKGVELTLERKIDEHVDYYANYTYLDDGDLSFYASRHKASGGINYTNGALKINLSESYVGSTWDGDAIYTSGANVGAAASRNLLAAYLLTNIKLSYQFNQNYKMSVGLENLFNRKYVNWQNLPMPGRAITCSLSAKF